MNEHTRLVLNFGDGNGSGSDRSATATQCIGPRPVMNVVTLGNAFKPPVVQQAFSLFFNVCDVD